jgi:hypothetical protein
LFCAVLFAFLPDTGSKKWPASVLPLDMKLYKISYRDQSGYHQQYLPSKAAAKRMQATLKKEINNPDISNQVEAVEMIDEVEIPTDKKGLILWLNLNNSNADGF